MVLLKDFQVFFFIWSYLFAQNDIIINSVISNYSEFQCKLMPTFFGVVELIHLDALKIVLVLTHIATLHISVTISVYLFLDKLFDSKFGFQNQLTQFTLELTLSPLGCMSGVYSLFNWTFINVLKNLYSRFGLISSCADQFNSWCSPMLRCLFICIFHNL